MSIRITCTSKHCVNYTMANVIKLNLAQNQKYGIIKITKFRCDECQQSNQIELPLFPNEQKRLKLKS